MFLGKSVLASFMLSTAVMVSGPNGEKVADPHISAPVLVVSEKPGASTESETAGRPENSEKADRDKRTESLNESKAADTSENSEKLEESDAARDVGEAEASDTYEDTAEENQQTETSEPAEGTVLTMLASEGKAQMLSVLIQSDEGKLVVIDGGWESDGDRLLEKIQEKGGSVDAWLITHPHADHTGALYHILRNRSDEVDINKIYYSFAPAAWYKEVEPDEASVAVNLLEEFEKLPEDMLCGDIGKNDTINVDNLRITVMNDRYTLDIDPVNNSSIVYKLETCGKKILFLGDLSYDGGARLVREGGDSIKADIVQMAHHGQNGIGQSAYETISPKICLWPTPQWLWDNDNGNGYNSGLWHTLATRRWMEGIGVEENYCTKDGDIVLQLD